MKFKTAAEIRKTWLDFFASKQHQVVESSSLIPQNDPTLLFVNAGVTPLKKYFDGSETPINPRLVNVQKCIRTNDIDNVGKTARHHTFFEMLGNFSIGNYFKEEAIRYGFELLTDPKWFGFDQDKLYITYYSADLDAKNVWLSCGIKESHLIALESNFWEIGAGPSGPDTEIFFDRGSAYDQRGKELIEHDIENERFIEIWNIVFSQYNAKPDLPRHQYPELPNKNIDTGAGLERFACVLQQTKTNFETDLFLPIINHLEQLSGISYDGQMAFKVIADHIKTLTFAIGDGAMLSNEGRGYVLRRLLRRAVKFGKQLGFEKPFLHLLVDDVVQMMGVFYRDLYQTQTIIQKIVLKEEEKFFETILEGEKHLLNAIQEEKKMLSGKTAFKLYDTYGFPIELTVEYAQEHDVAVDLKGFEKELKLQKERSRSARRATKGMKNQEAAYLSFKAPSTFIGYEILESQSKVIKVFDQGIVLDQTPFYATSGGQVADKGTINGQSVLDVTKLPNGQTLHHVNVESFEEGDEVLAIVDQQNRNQIIKNHSAAHLFHQAIKDVLGNHANQQGSQVTAKSWRFDFNHYETESDQTILEIEKLVKHYIHHEPLTVEIRHMSLDEAKKQGAMALFGEKYGDVVRLVDMGWSKELCGGTHVENTKEIIDFAIISYESIGSGIYRMQGVTGEDVKVQVLQALQPILNDINLLKDKLLRMDSKAKVPKAPKIIGSYQDFISYHAYADQVKSFIKETEKTQKESQERALLNQLSDYITDEKSKRQLVVVQNIDSKLLKQLTDAIYDKIKAETLFLVNKTPDKVTFICKSSVGQANELIRLAAQLTSGSGGGTPNFSQGGTQNFENLDATLAAIKENL